MANPPYNPTSGLPIYSTKSGQPAASCKCCGGDCIFNCLDCQTIPESILLKFRGIQVCPPNPANFFPLTVQGSLDMDVVIRPTVGTVNFCYLCAVTSARWRLDTQGFPNQWAEGPIKATISSVGIKLDLGIYDTAGPDLPPPDPDADPCILGSAVNYLLFLWSGICKGGPNALTDCQTGLTNITGATGGTVEVEMVGELGTYCVHCAKKCSLCCQTPRFRFRDGSLTYCAQFEHTGGPDDPCSYSVAESTGPFSPTLTCNPATGTWTFTAGDSTWVAQGDINGCPIIGSDFWQRTAGTLTLDSVDCTPGCPCTNCITTDCDTICCPEIFASRDDIANDGSGNFFMLTGDALCSWGITTGSGNMTFQHLTCTDGIWELAFTVSGVLQVFQAVATGNCCPPLIESLWIQTAGTFPLTKFRCKGNCVNCVSAITFTVTTSAEPALSGNYTFTRTPGTCIWTGPSNATLTAPGPGAVAYSLKIQGALEYSVGSFMDANGCPRLNPGDWVFGAFGISVTAIS